MSLPASVFSLRRIGAMAAALETNQLPEMLGRALAYRIGKCRRAGERNCDIFDLDEAAAVVSLQTEIEPAVRADSDFAANGRVTP